MSEQPESTSRSGPGSVDNVVTDLLAPVIATTGAELVDVEWSGGTLRIVVEEAAADGGGITADRLTEVNRLISPILDQHDPVPGKYLLEVSSPGVERPLRRSEHYRRAIGEDVIVKLVPGVDPRRVRGRLTAVDEGRLDIEVVEIDGVDLADPEHHRIHLDDVAKARTYFDWGSPPKGGAKNAKKNGAKNAKKKKSAGKAKQVNRSSGSGRSPAKKNTATKNPATRKPADKTTAGKRSSSSNPTSGKRGNQ